MNIELRDLVLASTQGDTTAFGKIVERYKGMVSAVAYNATGDLLASEDLAQETFLIAWVRLRTLQKREFLAAWLRGIVRNLAQEWKRKQVKSQVLSIQDAPESVPFVNPFEESESTHERHQIVWAALEQIPENYREPLILFYRQDRSIQDIAEALELTEDCVKQRLSRGRKMLREEVARLVEDTLEESRPGARFTMGVLAALPPLAMSGAPVPGGAGTGFNLLTFVLGGKTVAAVVLAALLIGGFFYFTHQVKDEIDCEPQTVASDTSETLGAISQSPGIIPDEANAEPSSTRTNKTNGNAVTDSPQGGKIMGRVYDKKTQKLLAGIQVEASLVGFKEPAFPEGRTEISSIVPSIDKDTGELLNKDAIMFQLTGRMTGISDEHGSYKIAGLPDGKWKVSVASSSIFMESSEFESTASLGVVATIQGGNIATIDLAANMGVPISGQVVDSSGTPVGIISIQGRLKINDAAVEELLCSGRSSFSENKTSFLESDDKGHFKVWGATPGDCVTLQAGTLGLPEAERTLGGTVVIDPVPKEGIENVLLVLQPRVKVSGSFINEKGAPIKATIWYREVLANGKLEWTGQGSPSETFELFLHPGHYELSGEVGGHFVPEPLVQPVTVNASPISNLRIAISEGPELESKGNLTLLTEVIDNTGKPVQKIAVSISYGQYFSSSKTLWTDSEGKVTFDELDAIEYKVRAMPGEPLERVVDFGTVNPAETPEITIQARRAPIVRARVLDAASDKPITNFSLEYWSSLDDNEFELKKEYESISSESGSFDVAGWLDKEWYIRVWSDGHASITRTMDGLSTGEMAEELEFRLPSSRGIKGVVTDEDGKPLEGAVVSFVEHPSELFTHSSTHPAAETDTNGRFVLTTVPADAQSFHVWKEGYIGTEYPIGDNCHIQLLRLGIIEGYVIFTDTTSTKASMVAAHSASPYPQTANVNVNEDGHYVLIGLMEGSYKLSVLFTDGDGDSEYEVPEPVEVGLGETVRYDITIP